MKVKYKSYNILQNSKHLKHNKLSINILASIYSSRFDANFRTHNY